MIKKDAKNELSQQWLTRQTRNPSYEIWITSKKIYQNKLQNLILNQSNIEWWIWKKYQLKTEKQNLKSIKLTD
jgi:hypothetical protein